jgi:hypothetical protein
VAGDVANVEVVELWRVGRGRVGIAAIHDGTGVVEQDGGAGRAGTGDADDVDPLAALDHPVTRRA